MGSEMDQEVGYGVVCLRIDVDTSRCVWTRKGVSNC